MTHDEVQRLHPGLYRLFWVSGGSSLAAVGMLHDGTRWFAPSNWTSSAWKEVQKAERISTEEDEPSPQTHDDEQRAVPPKAISPTDDDRRFAELLQARLSSSYVTFQTTTLERMFRWYQYQARLDALQMALRAVQQAASSGDARYTDRFKDMRAWSSAMQTAEDIINKCIKELSS